MAVEKKPEYDFQSMNTVSGLTPTVSRKRSATEKNSFAPSAISNFCALNVTRKPGTHVQMQITAEERFVASPLSYEYRRETKRGAGTRVTPPSVKDAEARRFREARRSVGAAVMALDTKKTNTTDYQNMDVVSGLTPMMNRKCSTNRIVDEQKKPYAPAAITNKPYAPAAITNFCALNTTVKPGAKPASRRGAAGAAVMAANKKPEVTDYQSMDAVSGLTPMLNRKRGSSIQGAAGHNPYNQYSTGIVQSDLLVMKAPKAEPAANHQTIKPKSAVTANQAQRAGAALMQMEQRSMGSPPAKQTKEYQSMNAVSGLTPMVNRQRRNSLERNRQEEDSENKVAATNATGEKDEEEAGRGANQRDDEEKDGQTYERPILGRNFGAYSKDGNAMAEAAQEDPTKGMTPVINRTKAMLEAQSSDVKRVSPTNQTVVMQGGKFVLNRVPRLDFAGNGLEEPAKRKFFAPNSRGKENNSTATNSAGASESAKCNKTPSRPGAVSASASSSSNDGDGTARVRVPRFRPTLGQKGGRPSRKQSNAYDMSSVVSPVAEDSASSMPTANKTPSGVDSSPSDGVFDATTPGDDEEDAFDSHKEPTAMRQRRPARRPRGKRVMTPAPVSMVRSEGINAYGGLFSERSNPTRPSCLRPVAEGACGGRPSPQRVLSPAAKLVSPETPAAAKVTPGATVTATPVTATPTDPEQRRQLIQEKRMQWREEKEVMEDMKEEFDDLLQLIGI
jgi:hypothetical protein